MGAQFYKSWIFLEDLYYRQISWLANNCNSVYVNPYITMPATLALLMAEN